jgi:bacterioferritin-associated ferredoxin
LETKKQLLDNLKKVCICRSIKAGTIMTAIREGSLTFEALRRAIGVGTGNCKAKRCRSKIEERIQNHKDSLKAEDAIVESEASRRSIL